MKSLILTFVLFVTATFNGFAAPLPVYKPAVPAPNITWKDAYGKSVSLADYKGQVVFLNFWATWCAPCKVEMPAFNFLQSRYDVAGFKILAINVGEESALKVKRFLDEQKLSALEIHIDETASLTRVFGAKTLPTTYVISRKGEIVAGKAGLANWMSPEMMRYIEGLLKEENPYEKPFSVGKGVQSLDLSPAVRF